MSNTIPTPRTARSHTARPRKALLGLAPLLGAVLLSACVTTPAPQDGGIGYRQARFAEVSAMREYRACRDEAFELDRQARENAAPAKYLASARLLTSCEANLGPEAASIAKDERFQAYALSVQNYMKGGDVKQARLNLENLMSAYPGQDLYYPDGSSYIDTMQMLLGLLPDHATGRFSTANVNSALKAELRRVRYWQSH